MSVEREIKLDVPDEFEMPDLARVGSGVEVRDGGTRTYETVWFDTSELRLARWGASLRFRDGEGWTLKLDRSFDRGMLNREELRFEGAAGSIPPEAADLVRAFARGAPLAPVVRATATRRLIELGDQDRPLVAVVDDAVEVTEAPAGASRFRQIELETLDEQAGARLARDVGEAMRRSGVPDAHGMPKIERALGGRPAAEIAVPAVAKRATVGELVSAAIAEPVVSLMGHDPGVRLRGDPEHVHKARVATRRLRSSLRTFASWLEQDWTASLNGELGWLADDLGAVRDADVMLGRLGDSVDALDDDDDRKAAGPLLERLVASRNDAGDRLAAAMSTERYERLVDRLVDAARGPALRGAVGAPADETGSMLDAPWTELRNAVERVDGCTDPDALHRVRICAKRVRYAAEAVQPAFGGRARTFAKRAAELQNVLGEHHDAVVLEAWLREVATRSKTGQAFVAGELAAQQRRSGRVAAAAWPDAWRSLSRKRNLFWT